MKNHYQPIIHHNLGLSLLALKNPHSSGRWGEKEQLGHSSHVQGDQQDTPPCGTLDLIQFLDVSKVHGMGMAFMV